MGERTLSARDPASVEIVPPPRRRRKDRALQLSAVQVVRLLGLLPLALSVAAFGLDERTITSGQARAGGQARRVHEHLVEFGRVELGQVQADELRVRVVGGVAWLATARAAPIRRWLGGVGGAHRGRFLPRPPRRRAPLRRAPALPPVHRRPGILHPGSDPLRREAVFLLPVGLVLFFVVPIVLWLLGAMGSYRVGKVSPLLAIIIGSDSRLSLSRLQAFVWTLVIFGAFVAAMAVSKKVTAGTWVAIPPELLQLAGIAIASGVFSCLIANVNGEQAQPEVTSVAKTADNELTIQGINLGTDQGALRVGGRTLPVHHWDPVPAQPGPQTIRAARPGTKPPWWLVVDTSNGKVCYKVTAADANTLSLEPPTTCPEWSDLFRDDKSPSTQALMKFQMFGWTVVAVVWYVILFLSQLTIDIARLPTVDPSIVILTGVSQAGYLAGKAASTVSK